MLDIGCNEGIVTLQLAAKFGTAQALGVDIDEYLIREASRCISPRVTHAACSYQFPKFIEASSTNTRNGKRASY